MAKSKKLDDLRKKNKGNEPKILDEKLIHDLASISCSVEEIASACDCSRDTIYANYADILQKGRDAGNKAIKSKIYEKALAGDTTLLVWVSKTQLGWREEIVVKAENYHVYVDSVPVDPPQKPTQTA